MRVKLWIFDSGVWHFFSEQNWGRDGVGHGEVVVGGGGGGGGKNFL